MICYSLRYRLRTGAGSRRLPPQVAAALLAKHPGGELRPKGRRLGHNAPPRLAAPAPDINRGRVGAVDLDDRGDDVPVYS